ncbi:MAG TPA: helix-turn-helix domain-containing protein [Kamptonema sp.]|nr:helix-turn-helix domain-containing protein [Kamptonema sp.]
MVLKPVTYFGAPEQTTVEISQESFRSILGQIEAELHCSEIYSRVLASLQTMLGEAASSAEILIKAISREAVRLAFQRVPKQNKAVRQTLEAKDVPASRSRVQDRPVPPPPLLPVSIMYQRTLEDSATTTISKPEAGNSEADADTSEKNNHPPQEDFKEVVHPPAGAMAAPTPAERNFSLTTPGLPKKKRLSKAEKLALAVQEREDKLRELGLELRKARQVRSLSLHQLHSQTLVPLHHLESLEKGQIEKLPEDIYIRGFIRRIGNALGLDGNAMATSLPVLEESKTTLPSWSLPETEIAGLDLRPVHLYVGYTALMAGAVGGIAWLSQQSMPGATAVPNKSIPSPASVSPSQKRQVPTPKPGIKKSSQGGIIVGGDMAPPEMISLMGNC